MGRHSSHAGAATLDAGAAGRALPRAARRPFGGVPDRPRECEPLPPARLAREICEPAGGCGRRSRQPDRGLAGGSALFEALARRPLASAAAIFAMLMELFGLLKPLMNVRWRTALKEVCWEHSQRRQVRLSGPDAF